MSNWCKKTFNVSCIMWDRKDFDIAEWEEADLPYDVTGFVVWGDPDWSEEEWNLEVIDKLSDCYGWCIESATVKEVVL